MKTSREIIDALGIENIAAAVGVDIRRVKRARYEPKIAAVWYDALCIMAGEDLPRDLFTFKRAAAKAEAGE
jgi:hypothetical protein